MFKMGDDVLCVQSWGGVDAGKYYQVTDVSENGKMIALYPCFSVKECAYGTSLFKLKENVMDKTTAQQQMKTLQAEMDKLKAIIDAPEKPKSLLTKPVAGSNDEYWMVTDGNYDKLSVVGCSARSKIPSYYKHGNLFQSEELAKNYAEAIDTMLLLRHCEGTEPPVKNKTQWVLIPSGRIFIHALRHGTEEERTACVSPCFVSEEAAKNAVKTVGESRIIKMFNTFHHKN